MTARLRQRTAPLRVLIVVQNLPFELDRRVRTECRTLAGAGYVVSVICPKQTKEEPDRHDVDGVAVYSYPSTGETAGVLSYIHEFALCWWRTARLSVRVARAEGFDVLQACNPPDTYWLLGLLWKLIAGKRFVYDQHDLCPEVYETRFGRRGPLHRVLLLLEAATYRTADHVISPNPGYQEVAFLRGRVPAGRSSVVMSTPDAAVMRRGEIDSVRRHGRPHLACYVGIMGPQDGVDRLLDAVHHYVHVLERTDCHIALLGFGDSFEALRKRAEELALGDWVTFTGRVDQAEIGRWLSTADVGFTPDPPSEFNHRSTMNKTLEYMAHGVAVVATDLQETRRCAAGAAVYAAEGTPEQLAAGLAQLLDDPVRRRRAGRLGRLRIERELAWSDQATAYLAAMDGLTGRRPSNPGARRQRITPKAHDDRIPSVTIDTEGRREASPLVVTRRCGG